MRRLEDRVAVVTGASMIEQGLNIGGATAVAMAREGAAVLVADLNGEGAERLAGFIRDQGGLAVAQQIDVCVEDDVARMVDTAVRTFGGLDILHNNAGGPNHGGDESIVSMEAEVWDWTFRLNARGTMLGCKHAIPHLLDRGGGSIINTSSGAALGGDAHFFAYGAAKAAVLTFSMSVAAAYGKQGIRCNAVCPGLTLSAQAKITASQNAGMLELYERHTLTPRLGEPEDLANAVVFLASDDAAFITGQVLVVDGGLNSHRPYLADTTNR